MKLWPTWYKPTRKELLKCIDGLERRVNELEVAGRCNGLYAQSEIRKKFYQDNQNYSFYAVAPGRSEWLNHQKLIMLIMDYLNIELTLPEEPPKDSPALVAKKDK